MHCEGEEYRVDHARQRIQERVSCVSESVSEVGSCQRPPADHFSVFPWVIDVEIHTSEMMILNGLTKASCAEYSIFSYIGRQ